MKSLQLQFSVYTVDCQHKYEKNLLEFVFFFFKFSSFSLDTMSAVCQRCVPTGYFQDIKKLSFQSFYLQPLRKRHDLIWGEHGTVMILQ